MESVGLWLAHLLPALLEEEPARLGLLPMEEPESEAPDDEDDEEEEEAEVLEEAAERGEPPVLLWSAAETAEAGSRRDDCVVFVSACMEQVE
jgi:hypothetical protein